MHENSAVAVNGIQGLPEDEISKASARNRHWLLVSKKGSADDLQETANAWLNAGQDGGVMNLVI